LEQFFCQYPGFVFNPKAPSTAQFQKLCKMFGHNDKWRMVARKGFVDALLQQFNDTYGTEVDDLSSWQGMCLVLEMDPIPTTLEACQEAVFLTHVNIVDLVDAPNTGEPVRWFPSEKALSDYTMETKKFFPSKSACRWTA
ncbi:hypothetical protein PILCRDRAFT_81329, partial [Piloderma croceum F 1598]